MKKIITTVGTSIFGNCMKEVEGIKTKTGNLDKSNSDWNRYKSEISILGNEINKWSEGKNAASAEIASLLKIQEELKETVEVYLICSETILSRLAAECIKKWFEENMNFEIKNSNVIKGLQVKDRKIFETEGLLELFDEIEKIAEGNWKEICINLTGGYKAIIPFLTIVGQIYGSPLYYIFEESESDKYELIKIPQTPIDVNWSEFEKYNKCWEDLRKGISNWSSYIYKEELLEDFHSCILLDEKNDYALISGIGEAFLNRYKQWSFIYVLQNGPFSQIKEWRNKLNDSVDNLRIKLNDFIASNNLFESSLQNTISRIRSNGGELNHTDVLNSTNCLLSKYPSANPEIRLLYSFETESGKISKLKIWDFRIGEFNHSTYPKEFKSFFDANKEGKFIPYLQVKNY